MNAPFLPPISPIFSRSSVSSVSSSTPRWRGLLRASAPVLLTLVLGVGLAGCDDTASTSSDAPSSTAPAESQQGSGSDGSADSEEAPAEEPAAKPTDDSSGGSGWFGGSDSGSGEGSEEEATPEPEPQKESYANCKEAKAAGAAPLYKDDPGYRSDLDGDGDGIACEK